MKKSLTQIQLRHYPCSHHWEEAKQLGMAPARYPSGDKQGLSFQHNWAFSAAELAVYLLQSGYKQMTRINQYQKIKKSAIVGSQTNI